MLQQQLVTIVITIVAIIIAIIIVFIISIVITTVIMRVPVKSLGWGISLNQAYFWVAIIRLIVDNGVLPPIYFASCLWKLPIPQSLLLT